MVLKIQKLFEKSLVSVKLHSKALTVIFSFVFSNLKTHGLPKIREIS